MPHASFSFTVQGQHVGFNNALKLSGLADFLQIAAWRHAQELGFGLDYLMKYQNCTWVMSRLRIDLNHLPEYTSKVHVTTWPKNKERLFAYRDLIAECNGKIIAKATSSYVLLDLKSRRPISLDGFKESILDEPERHAIKAHVEKINTLDTKVCKTIEVEVTDLDSNRHVNNIRYLDWAQYVKPLSFWEQNDIVKVEVNFLSELNAGDQVALKGELDENVLLVCGMKKGNDAFRVRMTLKPKE